MVRFGMFHRTLRSGSGTLRLRTSIPARQGNILCKFHASQISAQRKRANGKHDNLLDEEAGLGDDLFGSSETTSAAHNISKTPSHTTTPSSPLSFSPSTPQTPSAPTISSSQTLSDESRRMVFIAARESLRKFCGKTPATRQSPPRHALLKLVALSQDSDDLDVLRDALVEWRKARRQVDAFTSNRILARCVELRRPDLALWLLVDRPKYGVDLSSISVARSLLHELTTVARNPAEFPKCAPVSSFQNDPFLFAALYPKFRLPEVWVDPVSASTLASFGMMFPSKSANHKRAFALLREMEGAATVGTGYDFRLTPRG
ncbi:uncharacterized protein EI90DRAFT_3157041 [Cantharellus anzutake]|uniref:uncharacterized protein n=1 Tax=Cantharellus anzutake TaxID=1750568 RepID=UPI001905B6BF|nr:uncharacterized protein EI90DRAFT_3157041 [Cantharellus anzutake]KAF8325187.1 hypothetical protein EI90DRAFT_3157041 [Cantharellus anzutake]